MINIIRANIVSSNTATTCDITCNGTTPVLTLCRALIRAGHDPVSPLHCYRGDVLALTAPPSVTVRS